MKHILITLSLMASTFALAQVPKSEYRIIKGGPRDATTTINVVNVSKARCGVIALKIMLQNSAFADFKVVPGTLKTDHLNNSIDALAMGGTGANNYKMKVMVPEYEKPFEVKYSLNRTAGGMVMTEDGLDSYPEYTCRVHEATFKNRDDGVNFRLSNYVKLN
jgi:hypothetical protein